ncbi:SNF2-related [Macleaya cordata]|uniref:SNF2-related n=1 Tax=Macleaya cordata TaxID=56857 RepID=A0A200RD99_MACCD|nr:SNF2-related [Macleaya cordata]
MDTHTNKRPEPLRGGIFADDMGFGKTLTLISLIASDSKPFNSVLPTSNSVINTRNLDTNTVINLEDDEEEYLSIFVGGKRYYKNGKQSNKEIVGSHKKRKKNEIDSTLLLKKDEINLSCNLGRPRRTTLIVCPPSVLSTWASQLDEHIRPGMLKVFMFYRIPRVNDIKVEELQKYDIVLTTYDTLETGYCPSGIIILNMNWFRVILDEAHVLPKMIRRCRSVLHLKAKSRWVVSGMPILNGSFDLYFVMAFLRFKPFSDEKSWQTLVKRPIDKGNENGLSRLQDLVETISLRRLKGDALVGLPPKTVETCFVELSAEERVKYDQKEVDSQTVVRNYFRLGRVVAHYTTIVAMIQRLRQMCNDFTACPSEALPSYKIEDVSKNPELLRKMVSKLREGDYVDCPICYCPLSSDPIITSCGHIFCKNCILKALIRKNRCCPMCRHPISESDLFSAPPEESCNDDENKIVIPSYRRNGTAYSSKVSALLKLLVASRNENPSTKSVVFSQFRKMLSLLEEPLKAAGFGTLRLDGLMSAKGRADEVIKKFKNPSSKSPAAIVLLVDLTASESGIDLTGASRVYLLEPWLNPAVEERAIDRVHRIGRKEDMNIVRLITRNSIEERILELLERKKNLDFGKNLDQRQIRNEDLRFIMAL